MKLRIKIMLCMMGLLCVLFSIGGCILVFSSFRFSLEREQLDALQTYNTVVTSLQAVNDSVGFISESAIGDILNKLSENQDEIWTVVRLYTDNKSIYEYETVAVPSSNSQPTPWICQTEILRAESDVRIFHLSGALEIDGECVYLELAKDISQVYTMRQSMIRIFQWTYLAMTLLCGLISYGISKSLTRPLEKLLHASRSIASGNLDCRAEVITNDEIGLVAGEFNEMADVLQNNISELYDMLEQQNRFVGSFAHELKTPMTSLIGYADLIRGRTLTEDEQAEAAHYIVSEGKRLEKLSTKLLNLFMLKQENIDLCPAQPSSLIKEMVARLAPVFQQQGIELTYKCEEGVCFLETDLVKSLLVNLLDNARKSIEKPNGQINISLTMLDDGCRIMVQDNGKGIPKESLPHLTEAFYRVDKARSRAKGGVGLGLALCHEIVSLHHGELHFESEVGQGTTAIAKLRGGRL